MKLYLKRIFLLSFLMLIPFYSILSTSTHHVDAAANGWVEQNGNRYYTQNNEYVKGWLFIHTSWYYFDQTTAEMQTGWLFFGGKWYFFDQKGVMQTGWVLDGGKWYFLDQNGVMKTGWLLHSGQWYLLAANGAMQTGWKMDSGKWYYFDSSGSMKTGWVNVAGRWFYLNSTGSMKTGWHLENNRWYLLAVNGAMQTGWVSLEKWYYFNTSGVWIPNTVADELKTVWNSDQLILVTSNGYNTSSAKISTFEKRENKWFEVLNTSGYIGKYGFATQMREGGQKSPRGKYSLGTAFGRYANPGTKLPYRQITSDDVWVDDSNSSLYNTWQKASQNNGQWTSAEKMDVPAYNYGFVINYNTEERIAGAGSAIFFHVGSNYTLGCTAIAENQVVPILRWLDPAKKPIIIQSPESELGSY